MVEQTSFSEERCIPSVAIVILNYNDAQTTISLVESLVLWRCETIDLHVVIVDNRSIDDSQNVLYEYCAYTRPVACTLDFVCAQRNGGYSYGNNVGSLFALETYAPDYIAIANPDIIVDEYTMTELLRTFDVDKRIALCAPVVVAPNGSFKIRPAVIPTYLDDLRACRLRNPAREIDERHWRTISEYPNFLITQLVVGSFFVIRAEVLVELGMLDENVFLFCEERILGKKLQEVGYFEVIRTDLRYVHAHSTTIGKVIDVLNQQKILMRSRLYYQRTYGGCNRAKLAVLYVSMRLYLAQLRIYLMIVALLGKRA